MPVGTEFDPRKPAMEQRREPLLPPQIRAMQLELAAATQRERALEGELKRARQQIEELSAQATDDRVGPLQRRIQDLDREVFQAKQAEHAARKEAAKFADVEEALSELETLRGWKAEQDQRERERDLVLGLERQKTENRIAELVKDHRAEVDGLAAKLSAAEAKLSAEAKNRSKRR